MLRSVLFSLLMITLTYALKLYVDSHRTFQERREMVNLFEEIVIKAYSKTGIEWTIRGRTLEVVGKDVNLYEAELISEEAVIKASRAYIDRSAGEGRLTEGVELTARDLKAKTRVAYMNLREGRIWGKEEIELTQEKSLIKGEGFDITLKPLKIIINRARVNME